MIAVLVGVVCGFMLGVVVTLIWAVWYLGGSGE